jgi:hypothetical protein
MEMVPLSSLNYAVHVILDASARVQLDYEHINSFEMKKLKFLNLVFSVTFVLLMVNGFAQGTRTEKDLLGEKQISNDAYYGVQTARAWKTSR